MLGTAWVVFTTCRGLSFPSDVSESHGEFPCHMHHHIFNVCVAIQTVIERTAHHHTNDAVVNELCIGAFGAARCVSRMLKTRWVRVRAVQRKAHVRRKSAF